MSIEIKVPPSLTDSLNYSISTLYVREGQFVDFESGLFDVETDKVILEVVSPSSGIIEKIVVSEGESVSKGQLVMMLRDIKDGETPEPPKSEHNLTYVGASKGEEDTGRLALEEVVGKSLFNKSALICGVFGLVIGLILGSMLTVVWLGVK